MQELHKTLVECVDVRLETKADSLLLNDRHEICGVRAHDSADGSYDFRAPSVVLGTGGFQANTEWRVRYFGRTADDWTVRGSRYSTGEGINMAMSIGAAPTGAWGDFHTPIIDARSQKIECGETNVNQYQYTVMVNKFGERFLDEGLDYGDRTVIRYGKEVLSQPDCIAYLIYDRKVTHLVRCNVRNWEPTSAGSLRELAARVGLDGDRLETTIDAYNSAVEPGSFLADALDGKHTSRLWPAKSNWALTVDEAPFFAYRVTAGITFGFGGIMVNSASEVIDTENRVIPGLYAAGEMVGGLFHHAYPAGSMLTCATVLGRSAGHSAAARALDPGVR
jgi:tricarballylate dehydrogenase